MENRNNIILGILGVLVLAAAAYMLFFRGGNEEGAITEEGGGSDVESQFVNLTAQIDPVTFDMDILSDPRFTQLRDIRTAIVPEATGRTDPFAPLSGAGAP